jgi:hypothetical protein
MLHFLRFHIPPPIDWSTNQVANIIALISSIATVGALWYAITQGIKNSKKINDLAAITKQLSDQNNLILEQNNLQKLVMKNEVRPNFVAGRSGTMGSERTFKLKLTNNGHKAIVTDIECNEDYILFTKKELPISVQKDTEIQISGVSNGKGNISSSPWAILIKYKDVYGNEYEFFVDGVGSAIDKQGTSE